MPLIQDLRLQKLPQADIRSMSLRCAELGGINLSQGVCDLPTPEPILKATAEAVLADKSVYAPALGIPPLREAIAKKLESFNRISADPDREILVTNGVTGAYASLCLSLFEPGDGIMLFEPYYAYHYNQALISGLKVERVEIEAPAFEITREKLDAAYQDHVKAILLCTPSNPSGRMLTEDEIRIVGDFAREKDLILITDEIYEYFTYDGRKHLSPASFPEYRDRTVTMMGLSKTFSITGWRLGYLVTRADWLERIAKVNDLFYVCAPTPLQHGILAGFKDVPESYYEDLISSFTQKREMICNALADAHLPPVRPEGSYYVLADVSSRSEGDSFEAAMNILKECKVASVPGQAFFQSANRNRYVRFCFAIDNESLETACRALVKGAKAHG